MEWQFDIGKKPVSYIRPLHEVILWNSGNLNFVNFYVHITCLSLSIACLSSEKQEVKFKLLSLKFARKNHGM